MKAALVPGSGVKAEPLLLTGGSWQMPGAWTGRRSTCTRVNSAFGQPRWLGARWRPTPGGSTRCVPLEMSRRIIRQHCCSMATRTPTFRLTEDRETDLDARTAWPLFATGKSPVALSVDGFSQQVC